MFTNQKHVFWQALIITIIVFAVGVGLGFMLENYRMGKIDKLFVQSEIDMLDVKVQSEIYTSSNLDCTSAVEQNVEFADRIYDEARILDRYEQSQDLSTALTLQHKKYDLLRVLVLLNSLKVKEKCNATYHNVVYFYKYVSPDISLKAEQDVFSKVLGELKAKYDGQVLLIPIAADTNVSSVNLLIKSYNVSSLPTVLVDGKKLESLESVGDIEKLF